MAMHFFHSHLKFNEGILFFCLIAVIILNTSFSDGVNSALLTKPQEDDCVRKDTCSACIQTPRCSWCTKPQYDDRPRCFNNDTKQVTCEGFIYNPYNDIQMLVDKELTLPSRRANSGVQHESGASLESSASYEQSIVGRYSNSYGVFGEESRDSQKIVQIRPQRARLQLRLNEEYNLKVYYSQAEDYPVDLYYLMDLSKSMEDDKEKLSHLGHELSETMKRITSNFRLGFGSFVDKVLMPYVSTIPKNIDEPCPKCAPPYGYRHIMALSTDTNRFSSQVKAAPVSGNLDAPEGGFDAIMQAIACRSQIGWREQARRLLVFSTDAGFHYAGDGKLGGVISPNDGECHLDERGYYSYSTIQDYPSISQINQKVKQNAINVIFAVTQSQHAVYKKLSAHIEGSSSAVLSDDSSNVVELVRSEYNMKDNASNNIKIRYFSACRNTSAEEKETNKCDGLKVGDEVTFTAKISLLSCPKNPKDWKQSIQIYPVGLNESFIIDLELLCTCPCERPGSSGYEENSTYCHKGGTYKCGVCECDISHFGSKCECSNEEHQNIEFVNDCRPDNATNVDCSGRGTCMCGRCECAKRPNYPEEKILGKYCECDNFSCERNKQQLCSGPEHGHCECGHCICKPGWTGNSCDCQESNSTCIQPNTEKICSGHGDCECGVCKCKITDEGRFSGKYCEKCPTCAYHCHELKDCVQCQMYQSGPLKDTCMEKCLAFTPKSVERIEIKNEEEQKCVFYDEDDCKFTFKYIEEGNEFQVFAQEKKECPPKVFMLGIVLGVIAAIVLVGLAILLLWKLITTIHDRREFARFEKERMNAKWDTGENPIYKQATSTFKNPMYSGN